MYTLHDVKPTDTIENIKFKIKDKSGYTPYMQRLMFAGKYALNENTVSDYNMTDGSSLFLMRGLGFGPFTFFEITVNSLKGEEVRLDIRPGYTSIEEVLAKYKRNANIPLWQKCSLKYKGRIL